MTLETVRLLLEAGHDPLLWSSANMPGGDEANTRCVQKYKGRVRLLQGAGTGHGACLSGRRIAARGWQSLSGIPGRPIASP